MHFLLCHGGLGVLFGILAWAVTWGLKTQVEIMAHSQKLLVLADTDGVSNSRFYHPSPLKLKINSSYIVTHITTIPQGETKEQFL